MSICDIELSCEVSCMTNLALLKKPEMYATEALPSGDASSKDARRAGRRVETWFELSCVE